MRVVPIIYYILLYDGRSVLYAHCYGDGRQKDRAREKGHKPRPGHRKNNRPRPPLCYYCQALNGDASGEEKNKGQTVKIRDFAGEQCNVYGVWKYGRSPRRPVGHAPREHNVQYYFIRTRTVRAVEPDDTRRGPLVIPVALFFDDSCAVCASIKRDLNGRAMTGSSVCPAMTDKLIFVSPPPLTPSLAPYSLSVLFVYKLHRRGCSRVSRTTIQNERLSPEIVPI